MRRLIRLQSQQAAELGLEPQVVWLQSADFLLNSSFGSGPPHLSPAEWVTKSYQINKIEYPSEVWGAGRNFRDR